MVSISSLRSPADAEAFRALNTAWIEELFALEEEDRRVLGDPLQTIIAPGGDVLFARDDDTAAVLGCVALIPAAGGRCELNKMAVAPAARGRGIGQALMLAAIERARALGATSLFLGSSTKLPNAVRLYERVGFRHVDPATLGMPYARADVFMAMDI